MGILLYVLVFVLITGAVLLFGYPLLHELGHLAAAGLLGAEVNGGGLFPIAHVDLVLSEPTLFELTALSFGADIFIPFILLLPHRDHFPLFCIRTAVLAVWLADSLSSLACIAAFQLGYVNEYDDTVAVLELFPDSAAMLSVVLLAEVVIGALIAAKSDIICETVRFLDKGAGRARKMSRRII